MEREVEVEVEVEAKTPEESWKSRCNELYGLSSFKPAVLVMAGTYFPERNSNE
jgi:hypothetical protein